MPSAGAFRITVAVVEEVGLASVMDGDLQRCRGKGRKGGMAACCRMVIPPAATEP